MKSYASLEEYAKDIFADDVTDEEFKAVYTNPGVFIEEIPLSVKTHVWRAISLFDKNEESFNMKIDLAKSHRIETTDDLTKSDMNVIKPVYTNAYLQKTGIEPTEKAIKHYSNRISKKNIHVYTKKKGYAKEQIVINEKEEEYFNKIKTKSYATEEKCETILKNIRNAWSEIDEIYPRDLPMYKAKVFIPTDNFPSLYLINEANAPPTRYKSTLPTKIKVNPKVTNPFRHEWTFTITKEEIDKVIAMFSDKFDFKKNFKLKNSQIELLKSNVFVLTYVPRILFHCAKYIHSIFVLQKEDLPDFIRIRALWMILIAKYAKENYTFLSIIIVLMKVCTVLLIGRNSPKDSIHNIKDMEATVFAFIERLMNPHKLYDSMTNEPKSLHVKTTINIPKERTLTDILKLLDSNMLDEHEAVIATTMFNANAIDDLAYILNNEQWGDVVDETNEEEVIDDSLSLPVQKMIQQDIAQINWTIPRPVQDWMTPSGEERNKNRGPPVIASPYSLTSPSNGTSIKAVLSKHTLNVQSSRRRSGDSTTSLM